MLCSYCQDISPTSSRNYHYPSFPKLQASSEKCPICRMLVELFDAVTLESILRIVEDPKEYSKVIITSRNATHKTQEKAVTEKFFIQGVEVVTRAKYFYSKEFVLNFDGRDYSDRAIWRADRPVTFQDSFPVLKSWYEECTSNHSLCTSQPMPLPTRLLFIDPTIEGGQKLRLACTEGQLGLYAALSHCWGKSPTGIRATKDTLHSLQQAIDIDSLPKTFKDAVYVARRLGLKYLWIDSLCIIQDDLEDWTRESGRMATVFRNAHLTIAATAASDSNGGCLFDRQPASHIEVQHSKKQSKSQDPMATTPTYVRYPAEEEASLGRSPLYRRGWVLQEMVLSRRTVHFAEDQMFWHCRSRITSEDGYLNALLATTFSNLDTPQKAHQSWWTWVEDYSGRELTVATDKFVALAGLTMSFPGGRQALAGLWSDDIHFGLLWCAQSLPAAPTRDSMLRAPSWSWASINGKVKTLAARTSPAWLDHSDYTDTEAVILDSAIKWSGEPLTSNILLAQLTLRAKVAVATLAGHHDQDAITHAGGWSRYHYLNYHQFANLFRLVSHVTDFSPSNKECNGHCCFDGPPPELGSMILCLLISTTAYCGNQCMTSKEIMGKRGTQRKDETKDKKNTGCAHAMHNILLVEGTGELDQFQRIGVGTINVGLDDADYFSEADEMDLYLV
ncbi:heterokaryon incompatibility protein-domain-containing protein [Xylariales sp. PMI_506]|nr:heterokaryon incompatibility protein-domain-containing protein [Xylariales sp. PMI_506]